MFVHNPEKGQRCSACFVLRVTIVDSAGCSSTAQGRSNAYLPSHVVSFASFPCSAQHLIPHYSSSRVHHALRIRAPVHEQVRWGGVGVGWGGAPACADRRSGPRRSDSPSQTLAPATHPPSHKLEKSEPPCTRCRRSTARFGRGVELGEKER